MKAVLLMTAVFVVNIFPGPIGERVAVLENENKILKSDVKELKELVKSQEIYIVQDMAHKKGYSEKYKSYKKTADSRNRDKWVNHIIDAILLLLLGGKPAWNYGGKQIVNRFKNGGKG